MVVNRGFSFKNRVSEYKVVGNKTKEEDKHTPYILESAQSHEEQIYSQNSYDEGSVAYEFSAVDFNDIDAIIAFSNKYGLLYEEKHEPESAYEMHLRETHKQSDSIMQSIFSLFPEKKVSYACLKLHSFRAEVKMMRLLISLKVALDSDNVPEMIKSVVLIFLTRPANFELISPEDNVTMALKTESERLRYFFHSYIAFESRLQEENDFDAYAHMPIPKLVEGFIRELRLYRFMNKGNCSSRLMDELFGPFRQYTDINSESWKVYLCLIAGALRLASVNQDKFGIRVDFDEDFNLENFNKINIKRERIVNIAKRCLADFMNGYLHDIRPEIRIENGNITADWNVPTLLQAMYMELQVAFAPNVQVKKCANPTCNYFFDMSDSRKNRIYCSPRCALLMAKRRQRLREKNKKLSEK